MKEKEEQDLLENFFEAMDILAEKDREDGDFDLMKKAVTSLWSHLPEEKDDS